MKLLIAITILLCSCTASRPGQVKHYARFVRATGDSLVFITRKADSVYLLFHGKHNMKPKQCFTIKADSSQYKIIDGRKYFKATIKRTA